MYNRTIFTALRNISQYGYVNSDIDAWIDLYQNSDSYDGNEDLPFIIEYIRTCLDLDSDEWLRYFTKGIAMDRSELEQALTDYFAAIKVMRSTANIYVKVIISEITLTLYFEAGMELNDVNEGIEHIVRDDNTPTMKLLTITGDIDIQVDAE